MSYDVEMFLQVKQLEVALKESKERGIEDRQRMQKEIEQMKSWTRLRKQPAQKTSAHIGLFNFFCQQIFLAFPFKRSPPLNLILVYMLIIFTL